MLEIVFKIRWGPSPEEFEPTSCAGTFYSSPLGKLDYSSILKFVQGLRMVLDVVCQMEVDEKTAKWKSEYHGKIYYFCAPMCKQKFDRNPERCVKQT